jgi:hypothetical protein
MPRTLDINSTHRLALVTDDDLANPRYEPLTEAHQVDENGPALTYLPQYHAVADTVPMGVVTRTLGIPRDGWERLAQVQHLEGRRPR